VTPRTSYWRELTSTAPHAAPESTTTGRGVAALLEAASALGAEPRITNAVRFAFWGSESEGPTKYVRGLARDLDDVAMYLSVNMIGSPNAGYFTYDGDQSGQPNPDIPLQSVPAGSAGGRADAGGLSQPGRCATRRHTAEQDRRLWTVPGHRSPGRRPHRRLVATENRGAGAALGWSCRVAFDPNYNTARDNAGNHRPAGAVCDGSGPGVRGRHVRAVSRRRQRGSAAGPAAPEYALATLVTNW